MTQITIHIGADHGGFALKELLKKKIELAGNSASESTHDSVYMIIDHGAKTFDPADDYPQFAFSVAEAVVADSQAAPAHQESVGILVCRSGGGMAIAANKVKGARAVVLTDARSAQHAREHNHASIAVLQADWLSGIDQAWELIQEFLQTQYSQESRHIKRLAQVTAFENKQYVV